MTDPTERALALASEVLPAHEYLRPAVARVIQGVMDEGAADREWIANAVASCAKRECSTRDRRHTETEAERDALRREVEEMRSAAVAADLLSGDLRAITDLLDRLDYPFHPEHPDRDEIVHRICEMAGQLAKLRARDQRIRELAKRARGASAVPVIPTLLDAIEETP